MKPVEIIQGISDCDELEWLEKPSEDDEKLFVGHRESQTPYEIKMSDAVKNKNIEDMLNVLTGNRESQVLSHMTRIVGYYSKIENWNPSKLSELQDRHKGDYSVSR